MVAQSTMQQIADELHLHRLTVSSIINGKASRRGISERTIQRVQDYVRQQGYVPSRQAVALRTGVRSGIGILHTGQLYSHLADAYSQMTEQFSVLPEGLEIMVSREENTIQGLRELIARGIRKLIWLHTSHLQFELLENEIITGLISKVQTIIYNYPFDDKSPDERFLAKGIYLVGVNRTRGYARLAAFLKESGHRSIFLPDVPANSHEYLSSFVNAFTSCGLEAVTPQVEVLPSSIPERVLLLANDILETRKTRKFTAACFRDDEIAGFVMNELIQRGLRIPEDLSITGFDGHRLAPIFRVPLTTLRVPVEEMIQKITFLLSTEPAEHRHCSELELILRKSHCPVQV
ncbi:MAG: LacI family DNA-binding transcriptional regulator [Verrucomicrobiae bacterium]|nr:LacI family DNA-binding transcriptional regulator [Verrucomicrobiae bacterium]